METVILKYFKTIFFKNCQELIMMMKMTRSPLICGRKLVGLSLGKTLIHPLCMYI